MRTGAAAHPEVIDPDRVRRPGKVRQLIPGAHKGVQGRRKGADVGGGIPQGLHGRLLGRGAIRHWERGHVAGYRLAHLLEQWQDGARSAAAVDAHHIRAGVFQALGGFAGGVAVARGRFLVEDHGHDGRPAAAAHRLERKQRLADVTEGLANEEVDARLHRPADLLIEDPAHRATRGVIGRVDIGIREIAGQQRVRLHRHLPGNRQGVPVERLEQVFLADQPKLLAVPVIGERLDDVRAGVDELPMQLGNHLGMLEHDLGNKGARL